jgi:KDO2-lipid IV(A) lauroyltransferase
MEILLLFLGWALIPILPRKAILALARIAGKLTYRYSRKTRRISEANLDVVFGNTKSSEEKRDIITKSYQSFALLLLDLFWFNAFTKSRLEKHLKYDESARVLFDPEPHILLTAHFGNWEIVSLDCGRRGRATTSIAMPLRNPFVTRTLHQLRTKTGSAISNREGGIGDIVRALRNGHNTAMLVDQNTLPEAGGIFVPFFGLPVPVTRAPGALWARTKAKIVVTWCFADSQGTYTVYALPPFPNADQSMTSKQVITHSMQKIESLIRKHPEHWIWSYKRWYFWRESEDDRSLFPFYARSYERYVRIYADRFKRKDHPTGNK